MTMLGLVPEAKMQLAEQKTNATHTDIRRIAILNRGEPALRFLRAVREYNLERDTALEAVAFYTDPDATSPFVRLADDRVHLGAPTRLRDDGSPVSAYCDHEFVIERLRDARCDAVWPGWGFVAEDAAFVRRLEEEGITFVGPPSDAMQALGDKIEAKYLAEKAGVPLAPWRLVDPDAPLDQIVALGVEVGFPLMVKASAGGGGRGIRKVSAKEELRGAIEAVRDEVRKVFGAGGIMLERCITGARHIEVQLVADADSRCKALGIRDCSIQRRHQKILEEAPSPVLDDELGDHLQAVSAKLAELAGYVGVATAEYLYDPTRKACYFLEVNSRLQVEHTVTECVFGVDLVVAQIDIARGLPWQQALFDKPHGHAIEVRVNAENPEQGFAPSPGAVRVFAAPSGPGIRVDSGVSEGMTIAPEFDSMIAKVIAWAPTRHQASVRLLRALQELELVVEDGATNKSFLIELLSTPEFVEGTADTTWLDRAVAGGDFATPQHELEAVLAAAILEYRRERRGQISQFFNETENGIPQHIPKPTGMTLDLRLRGRGFQMDVHQVARGHYLVGPAGAQHHVKFERSGAHSAEMRLDGKRRRVLFAFGSSGVAVEVDGAMHDIERASGGIVKSPAPAMVVHINVAEGDRIEAGQRLCTLEAMKMEMAVVAQEAGIVKQVLCQANQQVPTGQPLVILEPEGEGGGTQMRAENLPAPASRPLDRLFAGATPRPEIVDGLDDRDADRIVRDVTRALESILLGFDVPEGVGARLESLFIEPAYFGELKRPERWAPLAQLLSAFADIESLFDRNLLLQPEGASAVTADIAFYDFCRQHHAGEDGLQAELRPALERALARFNVHTLESDDGLREALWRLAVGHAHADLRHRLVSRVLDVLMQLHRAGWRAGEAHPELRETLETLTAVAGARFPFVTDNARQAIYVLFEQSRYVERQHVVEKMLDRQLGRLEQLIKSGAARESEDVETIVSGIVGYPHRVLQHLVPQASVESPIATALLDTIMRRVHLGSDCRMQKSLRAQRAIGGLFTLGDDDLHRTLIAAITTARDLDAAIDLAIEALDTPTRLSKCVEIIVRDAADDAEFGECLERLVVGRSDKLRQVERVTVSWLTRGGSFAHRTYRGTTGKLEEDHRLRDVHPQSAERIELWRLQEFALERLESPEQIYAFLARAHGNPKDERITLLAEVHKSSEGATVWNAEDILWEFEKVYFEGIRILREEQSKRSVRARFHWNTFTLYVRPTLRLNARDIARLAQLFEGPTRGLGLHTVVVRANVEDEHTGEIREVEFVVQKPGRHRLEVSVRDPDPMPLRAMTEYDMRVVRCRRFGTIYPYETIRMLRGEVKDGVPPHPDMQRGEFVEYDLDAEGELVPVQRDLGLNEAGVIVGLVTNFTRKQPDGMRRIWLASDPTRAMGALAEPECRRIIAAIDLAERLELPIEWLPISAGAKIAMDSGTENLDWTAAVLRRLIEFTQQGGEVNILVGGVNVGAQSYWNAEATMLQHTRGILVMTRDGSMVLTGKKALEYSGGVAAEDERGIGGFERIMGPNGQSQYFARDLGEAYAILFEHYRFTYRVPGENGPRRLPTSDPSGRSVLQHPYRAVADEPFNRIGEIFDNATNPERKKPFAIREVMHAVKDQDGGHLERFFAMRHGESSVVWDAHVGGVPVCLIGIESRPLSRRGRVPMDGPETWTGGTLFPQSSKKVARAINTASGNRPVVVLANLSGFDGSPESLRKLQLEHGAEIGRAVTNFDGLIVFVVIGRYHGGAYVVFSKALNKNLRAIALEGTFASVIGGAPAAAVVFPREVRKRTQADPRVVELKAKLAAAHPDDRPRLREKFDQLVEQVTLERRGEVAREFDSIHTVQRAVEVGSLDAVIPPAELRPTIIHELLSFTGRDVWKPEKWRTKNGKGSTSDASDGSVESKANGKSASHTPAPS